MNAKTRFKKILEFKKNRGKKKRPEVGRLIEGGNAYEIGTVKPARPK